MSSVSQVEQAMQTVSRQANAIARQTGFVQRESKLTGERFVQTLVTAWLNNPGPSGLSTNGSKSRGRDHAPRLE